MSYSRRQCEEYPDFPDTVKKVLLESFQNITLENLVRLEISPAVSNMMLALTPDDWEVLLKNFDVITEEAICYVAGSSAQEELAELILALEHDEASEDEQVWLYRDEDEDLMWDNYTTFPNETEEIRIRSSIFENGMTLV